MATTKKKSTTPSQAQVQAEANALNNELGGSGTSGSTPQALPQALGITAADANLPVTFSLPHAKTAITAKGGVPGAQREANGSVVTTYANAVAALYKMDKEDVQEAQIQLIDAGYLTSSTENMAGSVNASTLTAWKRMALDAANSGTPISTLLASGSAAPSIVAAQKAAKTALQNAETSYAEAKTGGVTTSDPNEVEQALVSAYASIGETPPSPTLLKAFSSAFIGQQTSAESDQLNAEKTGEGDAISQLTTEQNDLTAGNVAGANAAATAPGPVIVGSKPAPNLDSEAMAQAKASDPGQYYATQSSYLYGLLLNSIRGTPSYQTAPTAPSSTAPGGADLGNPLVAPTTGAAA